MIPVLLLAVQILLLGLAMATSQHRQPDHVLYKWFNPVSFVAGFYSLFFLIPQVYGLASDYYLVGFPPSTEGFREQAFVNAQQVAIIFLFGLLLGTLAGRSISASSVPAQPVDLPDRLSTAQTIVLTGFLAVGVGSYLMLAAQLSGTDEFRSSLVKTTRGQILTTLAFFGNFAFTILLYSLLRQRRRLAAAFLCAIFAASIILTGSRGRLLWPCVIAAILFMIQQDRIRFRLLATVAPIVLIVLVALDPIAASLTTGTWHPPSEYLQFSDLFERRNFDGFSNLALILTEQDAVAQPSLLMSGARDQFMNQYFPEIYARGVGFGATVPGWAFLSGGVVGVVAVAVVYGFILQILFAGLSRSAGVIWIVGYLTAMTWLGAVGGNFVESLDKAFAASLPAVVAAAAIALLGEREEAVVPDSRPEVAASA